MRIVFIGNVEFSRQALEKIICSGGEVVGVCTLKDSPFNADHVDLTYTCEKLAVPCVYADDINSPEMLCWVRSLAPDVIFCFGWSRLLKRDFLNIPPMGVVGFHPAALPANRGRHPLIWALVLGLNETASTFFFMDEGADSGDILSQQTIHISDCDDAGSLYQKITKAALKQIEEFLPQLIVGTYPRQKQDSGKSNAWRKRTRSDGLIDWRMSADSIHNLVRGLSKPYVGAALVFNNKEIKVWKTVIVDAVPNNMEPGKVLMKMNDRPVIKCGENAICLIETEPFFDPPVGAYL